MWNENALKRLDENVIKKLFAYSDGKNNDDIENILDNDEGMNDSETDVNNLIKDQLED